MTNQQIIEKAIQKAIDGGWRPDERKQTFISTQLVGTQLIEITDAYRQLWLVNDILFNHDFAKALWGEKLLDYANIHNVRYSRPIKPDDPIWVEENRTTPAWRSHLQLMVVAEDPIKYLEKHI